MNITRTFIFSLFAFLVACVKPYDFDPENFEKVLVVDGLVTDQPGPYTVKITYTYPLDTTLNEHVQNADVWLEREDGIRIDYSESENGVYLTPEGFNGEVGHSYRLFIRMPDGHLYASLQETLSESPEIDSIYHAYAELPTPEGDRHVGGIQFVIDTHIDSSEPRYFRYEWEEGYKIVVPYPKSHKFNEDTVLVYLQEDEKVGVCYAENFSNELIYGTTAGSKENRMAEFPVRFVSGENQTLRGVYALLVKQYAISESAYLFYKRLKENNESGGSLFDKQTGSIFGNISSETNPDQAVLGFFEVSGVSQKRQFFYNRNFDKRLKADFPYPCGPQDAIQTTPDNAYYYYKNEGLNVYGYNPYLGEVYMHKQTCTDCSYYADTTPPDYWID